MRRAYKSKVSRTVVAAPTIAEVKARKKERLRNLRKQLKIAIAKRKKLEAVAAQKKQIYQEHRLRSDQAQQRAYSLSRKVAKRCSSGMKRFDSDTQLRIYRYAFRKPPVPSASPKPQVPSDGDDDDMFTDLEKDKLVQDVINLINIADDLTKIADSAEEEAEEAEQELEDALSSERDLMEQIRELEEDLEESDQEEEVKPPRRSTRVKKAAPDSPPSV